MIGDEDDAHRPLPVVLKPVADELLPSGAPRGRLASDNKPLYPRRCSGGDSFARPKGLRTFMRGAQTQISNNEGKPLNMRISGSDILIFNGFFCANSNILTPRWLPTDAFRQ